MDRLGMFSSPQFHTYSLPSLAEGSELISEIEEINEVKSLRDRGVQAAGTSDFSEALKNYNEALEIDDRDVSVLHARSVAFLKMGNFISALADAEDIISIDPQNSQGFLVKGLAYGHMNQFREALQSLLTALQLEPDNADTVTNHIAATVTHLCNSSGDLGDSLTAMDPYNKLSEVGVLLYQNAHYDLCAQVLETAQHFQTNQKGITMRILLTLANAHSKLGHSRQAISLYQDCLSLAVATHDQAYQTKALVNIATLHLESAHTCQAIVSYQKLLCLEAELLQEVGSTEAMPDYWTKDLQCGLHLNLSIAYKTIGYIASAAVHAHRYSHLVQQFGMDERVQAESYHNAGILHEMLGKPTAALDCYRKYLKLSRLCSDRQSVAQAYGCFAGAHAGLCNWPTAVMYHQQHIAMASKLQDAEMVATANEMLGDTYMLMGEFEKAVLQYETVVNACTQNENRTKAMALCKLGRAYRALGRSQYSLFFFEQAVNIADTYDFADVHVMADYQQASVHCSSTQLLEIEHAQATFSKLIPYFEEKIAQHAEEDSFCPEEYHRQLSGCYDGMLTVLAKLGNKEEALQYAETHRRRAATQLAKYHVTSSGAAYLHDTSCVWTFDRIHRTVSKQRATVIFYSLLEHTLLMWVLQPATGLVRFYSGRSSKDSSVRKQVTALLSELLKHKDKKDNLTQCESRAVPGKTALLDHLRKQNLQHMQKKNDKEITEDKIKETETTAPSRKSQERQLYEILLAPVEDILMKLDEPGHLVIVPDKELHHCPFALLQDWQGTLISKRFRLTYIPCLLLLDQVVQNEQNNLRHLDDLEFERAQSRKGGILKLLSQARTSSNSSLLMMKSDDSVLDAINLKQVSNPRLHTSGVALTPRKRESPPALGSKETTNVSGSRLSHLPVFTKSADSSPLRNFTDVKDRSPRGEQVHFVGAPVIPSKVLSAHTFSTVTTRTWTGTDITSSTQVVTTFQQISSKEKCVIFGAPALPESVLIHGRAWKIGSELESAKQELKIVAELVDADPIIGNQAAKRRFLQEIKDAAIIHIATYACLEEGILLMTPDPLHENREVDESSHIVTVEDIVMSTTQAKLVVISSGYTPVRNNFIDMHYCLPSAFIAAGAQCILMPLWQVPDAALQKFFFSFYHSLRDEECISAALTTATDALKNDDRFNDVSIWGAFILIGQDCQIQMDRLQEAMLDQRIDRAEKNLENESDRDILNLRSAVPHVPSQAENYELLQQLLMELVHHHHDQPKIIPALIDMLDAALKRLHTEDNNKIPVKLMVEVSSNLAAIQLLKRLGFHLQVQGRQLASPYVIFPHWNTDDLLVPSYDALKALTDLAMERKCTQALVNCLPLSQDKISLMIDLLCISKHAAEVQLKVSDLSVKPLWQVSHTRQLLLSIGHLQIGPLLTFHPMPRNRQLLTSLLQLLLSVSCYKSPVLLYRLDVSLLGVDSSSKLSSFSGSQPSLPSLTPLILPRNQLRMSTPWLSCVEQPSEMMEKMKLAKSKSDLTSNFRKRVEKAKTWHQTSVIAQAQESQQELRRPKTLLSDVKVLPGCSPSGKQILRKTESVLAHCDTNQCRDYAHHILQKRLKALSDRHHDSVMKMFLPYIQT